MSTVSTSNAMRSVGGEWYLPYGTGDLVVCLPSVACFSCRWCGYRSVVTDQSKTGAGFSMALSVWLLHSSMHVS